jgi:hypothetical protein
LELFSLREKATLLPGGLFVAIQALSVRQSGRFQSDFDSGDRRSRTGLPRLY